MSPTMRVESGRSTRSSTRRSSSSIATRVSSPVVLMRISRFISPTGPHAPGCTGRAIPDNIVPRASLSVARRGVSIELPDERARDDEALDLAGAFTNLADLRIAHHALYRIVFSVTIAA